MIFRPILGSSIFGAWVREWGSDSRMTDYKSRVKFDSYHINLDRWYSTTRSPRSSWLTIRRWWTMPPGSWGPKNPGQAWRLNMLPGWNYKISSRWDCQQNKLFFARDWSVFTNTFFNRFMILWCWKFLEDWLGCCQVHCHYHEEGYGWLRQWLNVS